MVVPVRI